MGVHYGYRPQGNSPYMLPSTLLFSNTGDNLTGWTVSSATVDNTLGNPAPSLLANNNQRAYLDSGAASLLNTTITLDMYVRSGSINLCNFYFGCNSLGAGYQLRLDGRSGSTSGIMATTTWTNWGVGNANIATRGSVTAATWHSVKIQIASNGSTSWYFNGTLVGTATLTLSGTFIGINGDVGNAGGNFDNIFVYSGIV